MIEKLKDCACLDPEDKHELSKAILTRINIYQRSIEEEELEKIISISKTFKKGEIEIKPAKAINQYKEIINRLEILHTKLLNTSDCK